MARCCWTACPVLADRRVRTGERLCVDVPETALPPPEPFALALRVILRGCLFLDDRQTRAASLLQLI